jgi:hypothetical protein
MAWFQPELLGCKATTSCVVTPVSVSDDGGYGFEPGAEWMAPDSGRFIPEAEQTDLRGPTKYDPVKRRSHLSSRRVRVTHPAKPRRSDVPVRMTFQQVTEVARLR